MASKFFALYECGLLMSLSYTTHMHKEQIMNNVPFAPLYVFFITGLLNSTTHIKSKYQYSYVVICSLWMWNFISSLMYGGQA